MMACIRSVTQEKKKKTNHHSFFFLSGSRKYYERTNELIQQYMYIDCLLDSTIPHELLNEYSVELEASAFRSVHVPDTIREESSITTPDRQFTPGSYGTTSSLFKDGTAAAPQRKHSLPATRTPQDIFRSSENLPMLQRTDDSDSETEDDPVSSGGNGNGSPDTNVSAEQQPLLGSSPTRSDEESGPKPNLPWLEDAEIDSDDPIVTLAIWVNFIANGILLAGKIAVIVSVPSMSVLASLVDAVLDFLSTAIVWTTTRLISSSQSDQYSYPVGRRR